MRVDRALDKLRVQLAKRGVTSTASALALALTGSAVTTAPAALATTVTAVALAAAPATTVTIGLLSFMASLKFKSVMLVVAAAGIALPLLLQHQRLGHLKRENSDLRLQLEVSAAASESATSQLAIQADQASRLQADQAELLRLRGELARLRRGGTPPTGGTPAAPRRDPSPSSVLTWQPGQFLAASAWYDAGSNTPESAVITWLWALMQGKVERLAAVSDFSPEVVERMTKLPPEFLLRLLGMDRISGVTLLERNEVSPEEVELVYEASWEGGVPVGMTSEINPVRVKWVENRWRLAVPDPIAAQRANGE